MKFALSITRNNLTHRYKHYKSLFKDDTCVDVAIRQRTMTLDFKFNFDSLESYILASNKFLDICDNEGKALYDASLSAMAIELNKKISYDYPKFTIRMTVEDRDDPWLRRIPSMRVYLYEQNYEEFGLGITGLYKYGSNPIELKACADFKYESGRLSVEDASILLPGKKKRLKSIKEFFDDRMGTFLFYSNAVGALKNDKVSLILTQGKYKYSIVTVPITDKPLRVIIPEDPKIELDCIELHEEDDTTKKEEDE